MKKTLFLTAMLLLTASTVQAQWVIPDRAMIDNQQKAFCGFEEKYKNENWNKTTMYLNFLTNFQYTISDRKHQDFIKEEIASVVKYRYDQDQITVKLVETTVDSWTTLCKIQRLP